MRKKKDDYKTMLFDDDGYSTRRGICRLVGVPPGREENGQFVMFPSSSSIPRRTLPPLEVMQKGGWRFFFFLFIFFRKTLLAGRNV